MCDSETEASDSEPDESVRRQHGLPVLSAVCEGPRVPVRQPATHLIIRVASVTGVTREEVMNCVAGPGRRGLGHFFDTSLAPDTAFASAMIVRTSEEAPLAPRMRRCAQPFAQLTEALGSSGQPSDLFACSWENGVAEGRARLRIGEDCVQIGLVVGTEVLGVTRPIYLRDTANRRFLRQHEVYRSELLDAIRDGRPLRARGAVKASLELWPPGSTLFADLAEAEASRLARGPQSSLRVWHDAYPRPPPPERRSCPFCDGLGRRACVACAGHGALVCKDCDGMPPLPCALCGGAGKTETGLETIDGRASGAIVVSIRSDRCRACWGIPLTCRACFGLGTLRCAGCAGAGWTPCMCGAESTGLWV